MARDKYQKAKLLCLHELLMQDTDEEHPLRTIEICKKLADRGIPCDRRILSKDIAMLNGMGFEVMTVTHGRQKAYYIEDRSFSVPELKILIDAVQAAAFITETKTKELTEQIARLGGTHRAELLLQNVICFNTRKHSNESVYYTVNFLEGAIRRHNKASFLYYDLNEHHEKIYRKNKERYVVEPMALVYSEDNYYLMCFSPKYDGICNYRVDRMENVEIVDEPVSEGAVIHSSDVGEYTEQVFKMYGGAAVDCVLQFDESLIGVVYDKFGEDTPMMSAGKGSFVATVKVQISPTFWGWIFQFVGRMRILSPVELAEQYRQRAGIVVNDGKENLKIEKEE